jgi:hypothetical protein
MGQEILALDQILDLVIFVLCLFFMSLTDNREALVHFAVYFSAIILEHTKN